MKDKNKQKLEKRNRRHEKVRAKIFGTGERPRLNVFRGNKYVFVQLIDDKKGRVLLGVHEKSLDKKLLKKSQSKTEKAFLVGKMIGEKALQQGVKVAVFDRGGYKYHGRVKAVAEGALKAGLKI